MPSFARWEPSRDGDPDEVMLQVHVDVVVSDRPSRDAAPHEVASIGLSQAATIARVVRPSTATSPAEASTIEPPIAPSVSEHPPAIERPSPSLAPADVARAFLAPGWVLDTDRHDAPVMDVSPGSAGASEQDIERALSGDLRARAMTKTYLARERPEVVAQADGSHVYVGHAFTATIRRDGSVEFSDRPAGDVSRIGPLALGRDGSISYAQRPRDPVPPALPELLTEQGGIFGTPPPTPIFDVIDGDFALDDELMRAAGQDPYFAEREWFMEHTAELRESIEDRFVATTRARGLRALGRRLADLWRDDARAPAQRRAALFELWDECDEDEHGGAARALIIEFIRTNARPDSSDAYTPEELERLNASRASAARFEP